MTLDLEALEAAGARVYGVGELVRELRRRIEVEFPPLLVEGEVSNFSRHPSGHCYFTVKDDESQLRCALFRTDALRLGFVPRDGECLVLFGRPTVYGRKGELQFVASRAFRRGGGKTAGLLEELKRRLHEEGLFRLERKRPIPFFPKTIGVVTSRSGAAIHDILSVIRRRAPGTDVFLLPVPVQGDGAAREICRAIDLVNERYPIDVLIVGRGGGSLEDLWAFNDEGVARAVFRSRAPVISAVGHEIDVTICDLVADVRAPTPSVAAELAVPDAAGLIHGLNSTLLRLVRGEARSRARLVHRLDGFLTRYGLRAVRKRLEDSEQSCDDLTERLVGGMRWRLDGGGAALRERAGRLEALSPLATLARGYAIVERLPDGRLVRAASELAEGEELRLRFAADAANVRVVRVRGGADRPSAEGAPPTLPAGV